VIIRKSLLALTPPPTFIQKLSSLLPSAIPPVVLDFATIAKNNSLYNTLPIFNLYVATLVLQSLVSTFGQKRVSGQQEVADAKAKLLYDTLDSFPDMYLVVPEKKVRSRMNICFRVVKDGKPDEGREKDFVGAAEKKGLLGVKGHRSVGGIRVSNYNAVPMENVEKLVAFIKEFGGS
jgi:phosphoserine aminotransferase